MMDYRSFEQALADAENQPNATYQGLCSLADQIVGIKLFTLTEIDNARREARRVYTNMPDAYPLLGTKPMRDDVWSKRVLGCHETFVANSIDAIAEVFSDYELIQSLGCSSVINIPVVVSGRVLGTINCLHRADHYTPDRVALSRELKLPGATVFLLNQSDFSQGDQ